MSQDAIGAYETAVDAAVQVIQAFPHEHTKFGPEIGADRDLLAEVVDAYADRAGTVFDTLIAKSQVGEIYDRLFALAAGDFRLAAALVSADEPWPADETEVDERAADMEELRAGLGGLGKEMDEIKAAVRGEPEDSDGGDDGSPEHRDPPPQPPSPRAKIPPLYEFAVIKPLELESLAAASESVRVPVEVLARPISGAEAESLALVHSEIDSIIQKASEELSDLALGGLVVGAEAVAEFGALLVGHLGPWYQHVQEELSGWTHRAKRAALKLLYEGIDKLLSILRNATMGGVTTADRIEDLLGDLAGWVKEVALGEAMTHGLNGLLRVGDLKTRATTALGGSTVEEKDSRIVAVGHVAKSYRERKFPMVYGRRVVRVARLLGLHHMTFPYGEIAMGCTILTLSGVSGWMAQDALDYPELRFVPDFCPGVRSAVEGTIAPRA
jgi:hypothetical protein